MTKSQVTQQTRSPRKPVVTKWDGRALSDPLVFRDNILGVTVDNRKLHWTLLCGAQS